MKEGEKGQIAVRIGNQIQIVAGIIKVAGRIPANVAVRLREKARTGATPRAVADFMTAFSGGGHNGRSVSRKGQVSRMNDAAKNGLVQETGLKDGEKSGVRESFSMSVSVVSFSTLSAFCPLPFGFFTFVLTGWIWFVRFFSGQSHRRRKKS